MGVFLKLYVLINTDMQDLKIGKITTAEKVKPFV